MEAICNVNSDFTQSFLHHRSLQARPWTTVWSMSMSIIIIFAAHCQQFLEFQCEILIFFQFHIMRQFRLGFILILRLDCPLNLYFVKFLHLINHLVIIDFLKFVHHLDKTYQFHLHLVYNTVPCASLQF